MAGCGNEEVYDICSLSPLTADKCAKYNGDGKGESLHKSCMVTNTGRKQAVVD
jgi:hypothetical protein